MLAGKDLPGWRPDGNGSRQRGRSVSGSDPPRHYSKRLPLNRSDPAVFGTRAPNTSRMLASVRRKAGAEAPAMVSLGITSEKPRVCARQNRDATSLPFPGLEATSQTHRVSDGARSARAPAVRHACRPRSPFPCPLPRARPCVAPVARPARPGPCPTCGPRRTCRPPAPLP